MAAVGGRPLRALVGELMTPAPRTIMASAELDEAMRLMDRNDIRHLPVLEGPLDGGADERSGGPGQPEAQGFLTGMLSDRDLLAATGWLPAERRRERLEPSDEGRPRRVREVMSSPAVSLCPNDRVFDLALRMVTERIGSVAVVEGERLVGIATDADLLGFYSRACREVSGFLRPEDTVSRAMSASPVVVRWSTSLDEAAEAMADGRFRHLPVVAGGEVVGIVSDRDLRRAFGRGLAAETILEDVMTRDVAVIRPNRPLCEAADSMRQRSVSSLPVVVDETLVGILTTTDLACYCLERFGAWSRDIA